MKNHGKPGRLLACLGLAHGLGFGLTRMGLGTHSAEASLVQPCLYTKQICSKVKNPKSPRLLPIHQSKILINHTNKINKHMNTRYMWKSFRWVKNHKKWIKTLHTMCNYKQSYPQLESSQSPPKYTYRISVHHTQCVLDYRCLESTSLLFNYRNPLKDFVLSRNSPRATLNPVNKDSITHGNLSTLHDS